MCKRQGVAVDWMEATVDAVGTKLRLRLLQPVSRDMTSSISISRHTSLDSTVAPARHSVYEILL